MIAMLAAAACIGCGSSPSPARGNSASGSTGGSATTGSGSTGGSGMTMGSSTGSGPTSTPLATPVAFDAVYVVNGGDSTISVVNAETNTVAGTITLQNADYPHHISLSPDRSMLAVAVPGMDMSAGHHGGMPGMHGAVMVLDALTGRTMASRFLTEMNHNAAWSPDGSELWTSQMIDNGSVLVLNAADLSIKATINLNANSPAEVSFSHDGSRVFVANEMSNSVTVIDAHTKALLGTVAVGMTPVGAWSGLNGVMYVTNEMDKTVTAIDAQSLQVVRTYNLGFTPGMAVMPPGGSGRLWISNEDQGQIQVNMTSMDMIMATVSTGAGAHGIAFAPSGSTAFVSNQVANTVSIVGVSNGLVVSTLSVGQKPNGLVFRSK